MSRLWITGYRNYELGVFNDSDPKVPIIMVALKNAIEQSILDGVDWIISGGQLGTEQWALKAATELKSQYPGEFQTAMMLPFAKFGNQWGEANQLTLSQTKTAVDFSAVVSDKPYHSPEQLRNYQEFMLTHTDQAILLYDLESPGKTKYDYERIVKFSENREYPYRLITFDDLQETAEEYQENLNNSLQDD
ncbi:DUF1273 domain-containing protein [Lentilactobacillus senioris]|uniref:DUF1273 domain-containing protein n=1 Tax=Lentilactobacillus senioris TaxID=931534 RepID=UPI00227DF2DD|nr:DUF1273 domain-containing protein [Lentilactobacillus senioris]MCY9806849.1 DUF1273 domain-containing protein [Lentilactobacillus senioris]